jgi:hypothetical protein
MIALRQKRRWTSHHLHVSAVVADADDERVAPDRWHAIRRWLTVGANHTACMDGRQITIGMPRQMRGVGPGTQVDHRHDPGLDHRPVSRREAMLRQHRVHRGSLRPDGGSAARRVRWHQATKTWGHCRKDGRMSGLGRVMAEEDVAFADDEAAKAFHDECASWPWGLGDRGLPTPLVNEVLGEHASSPLH